jgi:hypothetical protein
MLFLNFVESLHFIFKKTKKEPIIINGIKYIVDFWLFNPKGKDNSKKITLYNYGKKFYYYRYD